MSEKKWVGGPGRSKSQVMKNIAEARLLNSWILVATRFGVHLDVLLSKSCIDGWLLFNALYFSPES